MSEADIKGQARQAVRRAIGAKNGAQRYTLDRFGDLLTVSEYAEWARRSKNGAYQDIAQRLVPVIRFGPSGRVLRIPKAALVQLCQSSTTTDDEQE